MDCDFFRGDSWRKSDPGLAANIIVAEKAARIDSSSAITFFNHIAVCFFVNLYCCGMGAILITDIVICDNGMIGVWKLPTILVR